MPFFLVNLFETICTSKKQKPKMRNPQDQPIKNENPISEEGGEDNPYCDKNLNMNY